MKSLELLIIKIGKKTTFYSFIIGTILLIIFSISKAGILIMLGQKYLLFTLIFNLIVFSALIISSFVYTENRNISILTAYKMLVIIPIAILYFFIVLTIAF
ncbi:hypothetical protein [Pedobacter sp. Leaf250]|uniref:hypothetical protein n=1 Tax=Pedobacter sp. Leaf250 TaxID=2876559 RepID=UPI001E306511|nr:hypothetical protein [Pedobacter sp. Leaf250]